MGLNLASLLTESAGRTPSAPAIRLGDVDWEARLVARYGSAKG